MTKQETLEVINEIINESTECMKKEAEKILIILCLMER